MFCEVTFLSFVLVFYIDSWPSAPGVPLDNWETLIDLIIEKWVTQSQGEIVIAGELGTIEGAEFAVAGGAFPIIP